LNSGRGTLGRGQAKRAVVLVKEKHTQGVQISFVKGFGEGNVDVAPTLALNSIDLHYPS